MKEHEVWTPSYTDTVAWKLALCKNLKIQTVVVRRYDGVYHRTLDKTIPDVQKLYVDCIDSDSIKSWNSCHPKRKISDIYNNDKLCVITAYDGRDLEWES